MKVAALALLPLLASPLLAGDPAVALPPITVHSDRVANQSPVATFAMPVSVLRYEPGVDIQARNLAEGQADVTIRGGIFETVGFQIGAVSLMDPQTGHYLAEIPIAPAMLSRPTVHTGADLAVNAINATSGAVGQTWRPIRNGGYVSVAAGEDNLRRADYYHGFVVKTLRAGGEIAADLNLASSKSDGSVAFGDHDFDRVNGRLQVRRATAQTDLFAGYQAKFFGWPNLYTPFNSPESENLQTVLFALHHRVALDGDDFIEFGAYHRRNKDDYAFNRFAPLGPVHPFQHTTRVAGAALNGRRDGGANLIWNFRAKVLGDRLHSTSLTAGRYKERQITKVALLPEKSWSHANGSRTTLKLGATYDDSSHERGVVSPVAEISREAGDAGIRRWHLGLARTTQVPTYTALNSSATAGLFRGNPDLGRSTADQVELGLEANLAGWSTQAAAFWRRDDELVDWTFRRGVTARTANAVNIDTTGIELFARRTWTPVDFVLGYTWLDKDEDYGTAAVDASFYALNYARHRLTAAFVLRLGHGFEVRVDNMLRLQADNLLRTAGGDHAVFTSLGLSYRPIAWRGLEIIAQVENLWDSEFQEVPAVPAARRQVSGGINYAW